MHGQGRRARQWCGPQERAAKQAAAAKTSRASCGPSPRAKANGLKAPILRTNGLTLSLRQAVQPERWLVYAKRGDTYLGKISPEGAWRPVYAATKADEDSPGGDPANPLEAALAYARETKACACCGILLTDPVSVARGIGPICAEKWGSLKPHPFPTTQQEMTEMYVLATRYSLSNIGGPALHSELYEVTNKAELIALGGRYDKVRKISGREAHNWVRNDGVHNTGLYLDEGRIRKATGE